MKYLHKISLLLSIFAMGLFASCDTENEGAIYESTETGLSFIASTLQDVVVTAANPTLTVDIFRSNTTSAATGSIIMDAVVGKEPFTGCTITNYSFNAGEGKTTVTIDVTPLIPGQDLDITLTLPESEVGKGGVGSTTFTVSKALTWSDTGTTCTFIDDNFSDSGTVSGVKIFKADGLERYKIVQPYQALFEGDADVADADDIIFTLNSDGSISFANGNVAYVAGYYIYWDPVNYDGYCYVEQDGNAYYVNHLLRSGSSLYIGGFGFIWNK